MINTFEKIKMSLSKNTINSIEVKNLISSVIEQDLFYSENNQILREICQIKSIVKNKTLLSQELSRAKEHTQSLIDRGYIDTVGGLVAVMQRSYLKNLVFTANQMIENLAINVRQAEDFLRGVNNG